MTWVRDIMGGWDKAKDWDEGLTDIARNEAKIARSKSVGQS